MIDTAAIETATTETDSVGTARSSGWHPWGRPAQETAQETSQRYPPGVGNLGDRVGYFKLLSQRPVTRPKTLKIRSLQNANGERSGAYHAGGGPGETR